MRIGQEEVGIPGLFGVIRACDWGDGARFRIAVSSQSPLFGLQVA